MLRDYRDWVRQRLGILTPIERYEEYLALGTPAEELGARPLPGDWPSWSPEPSNRKLNTAIHNACDTVNRQANVSGVSRKSVPIAAQTANGPLAVELGSLPGWPERSVLNVRRAWWDDGSGTLTKLRPNLVGNLDRRGATYVDDAPGTPYQQWVEGYTLFIHFAPAADGHIVLVTGDGLLAPDFDDDQFDPIPGSYDPSILYIALVELGKMLPNDVEMANRAKAFLPDAQEGLKDLLVWVNGGNNEETNPTLIFDARSMRRWSGRRR